MKCLLTIYDGRKEFYQWDTNQKLKVDDDNITQVHFANKGMTYSLVTDVYEEVDGTRVCSVPDVILQIDKTLIAYAYLRTKRMGETLYEVKFNVRTREIPSDYVYNLDAEMDKLDDRITELENKVGDTSVQDQINVAKNEIVDGAQFELNTLNKLSNALNNDPNFHKTMKLDLSKKVDKEPGKGLSENDFNNYYKNRLDESVQYSEVDQIYDPKSEYPQSGKAVETIVSKKVDKIPGKQLSDENFTTTFKLKLEKIEENATHIEIDNTLKKQGFAADAKSVGDALDTKQPVGDYIVQNEIADWAKQPNKPVYNYLEVGAEKQGVAESLIFEHNKNTASHLDIRDELKKIKDILTSPDVNLDTLTEVVKYITDNRELIEQITTDKVNVSDIINNLTTNISNKPLSASMGFELKNIIDQIIQDMPNEKVIVSKTAPQNLTKLWVDTSTKSPRIKYYDSTDSVWKYADQPFIPKVDATLSKEGWAADAKVTGQEIPKNKIYKSETEPEDKSLLWIDLSDGHNPEKITVDPTLAVKGAAAESETVGIKFTEIEQKFIGIKDIVNDAKNHRDHAEAAARNSRDSEIKSKEYMDKSEINATNASKSEINAKVSENTSIRESVSAMESATKAEQAMSDFLAMLGKDFPTLDSSGKIPISQIPATAIQDIFEIDNEEKLTTLNAQRGDVAELIAMVKDPDTGKEERTVVKSWQCLGDPKNRESWVVCGTSYAVLAGNASTAGTAENANKINGHRMVEMEKSAFDTAVKDPQTYYLVHDPASEV